MTGRKRKLPQPILTTFRDGAFHPASPTWAKQFFAEGENYYIKVERERFWPGHKAFMAFIREAWQSLPESKRVDYPNEDFFRYRLLIAAGYSERRIYVCRDEPEAIRMAELMDKMFPPNEENRYRLVSLVSTDEGANAEQEDKPEEKIVLIVEQPLSQAMDAMDSETFWQSVDAVEECIATMFGVTRETIAAFKRAKQKYDK